MSRSRPIYVVPCDLLFIFSLILIAINHITSLTLAKQDWPF